MLNSAAVAAGDLVVRPQPGGVYGDMTSFNYLPGQNTSPPSEKIFGSHYIVKVDGSILQPLQGPYFDPSYGVTYLDANDMESKAIDGYIKFDDSASPLDPTKWVVKP